MKLTVYIDEGEKQIEFNTIKFHPVAPVFDDMPEVTREHNRQYNRSMLASGVKGFKCLYAGKLNWVLPDGVDFDMPQHLLNYRVSSCEVYENGAINCYCRMREDDSLVGYILAR
jgi:hypothetical protein